MPIISSGEVIDEYYITFDTLTILDGGVANSITVEDCAEIIISSGGTANDTDVSWLASMTVEFGGTANKTWVDRGLIDVSSGGTVNSTTVSIFASMYISSGGTASNTTIREAGCVSVSSGGMANGVTINNGGGFIISSGGTATEIIENGGYVRVEENANVTFASNSFSGQTISATSSATIHSGTTANNTTVDSGRFYIYSGGTANNTTVKSRGEMEVSSGGMANGITVNSSSWLKVFSGGTANGATVSSGGYLRLSGGGKLTGRVTFASGAKFLVSEGGILDFDLTQTEAGTGALVNDLSFVLDKAVTYTLTVDGKQAYGEYMLAEGASGFDKTISIVNATGTELGSISVGQKVTIDNTDYTLNIAGGSLSVTVEESASPIISGLVISSGQSEVIHSGEFYEDTTILPGGSMYISSGGTANNTFNSRGVIEIEDGGTANSTTVGEGHYNWWENGQVHVSSGGTVTDSMITGGSIFVLFGGTANDTTIDQEGGLSIDSGARADGITMIGSDTELEIEGGGTATNIVAPDGVGIDIIIAKDTYVQGTQAGNAFQIKDGVVSGYIPTGWMRVGSGCMATDAIVNIGCKVDVVSGGTANSVTVTSGGYLYIYEGGTATNILWTPCVGRVRVKGDAHVTFVSQYSGVYFGSDNQLLSHTTVMNYQTVGRSCNMYVMSGGTANYTTVNEYGWLFIYSGGTANNTIFDSCEMHVLNGGVANNVTMRNESGADCYLDIYSGGTVNSVTVSSGATLDIYSGGTANSVTVTSGGCIYFTAGGRLTGQTIIENGAYVSAYSGAILDFDISELAPDALARVKGLSRVSGWKDIRYTLTVDGKQASGNYALAEGAAGFDRTISVLNASGAQIGTLTVGQKVLIGNTDYTLHFFGDTLTVEVVSSVVPAPLFYPGDFAGNKKSMLAVEQERVALIYNNGMIWGGLTLDDGWSIAGVGDFNGDGADDILRVHTSGLVIGEMSNGNGTFSPKVLNFLNEGWEILGTGDFNGNGVDDVLIANPTAASETVGLLGYWESGSTWTLINGYSAEWECVATGDFNADGKCDMLWRNSFEGDGGLTYNAYCTWIVEDPIDWRMVSVANPDEWNFLCSGDFDGDKMNDIAMINDVGVVGIWGVNDGWLSSWSILSAVNPAEWTLAGVGDFNGDGTDDIAWCNTDSGLAGYWQIENKELASWQNIAVI